MGYPKFLIGFARIPWEAPEASGGLNLSVASPLISVGSKTYCYASLFAQISPTLPVLIRGGSSNLGEAVGWPEVSEGGWSPENSVGHMIKYAVFDINPTYDNH